jgi:hypothetical protein
MAKSQALAKAFRGRWRIVEMKVWPDDYLDLIEPAHITFEGGMDGVFVWATTMPTPPRVAAGPPSAPLVASSATFSFTIATIQPSSPNVNDFFNVLLRPLLPSSA